MITLRLAAMSAVAALIAVPVIWASPASAEDEGLAVVTTDGVCFREPQTFTKDVRALTEGEVVQVTQADDDFVRIRAAQGLPGCWTTPGMLSGVLPGPLDPGSWGGRAVVIDATSMLFAAEALTAGDLQVRAAPAGGTTTLLEVESGDLLTVAPWSVSGGVGLAGADQWTPVSLNGVLGWIRNRALTPVPERSFSDLTGTLTPEQDVTVYTAPSRRTDSIGTLVAGAAVPSDLNPVAGWYAVGVGERVGWLEITDLMSDPETEAASDPTPTPGAEEPGLADKARAKYDAWKADRAQKAEGEGPGRESGLWATTKERAKNFVTGRSPVTEAAAHARLLFSYGLGAIALLLTCVSVATDGVAARMMRRRVSIVQRAASAVVPGLVPTVVWTSTLAAPAVAIAAACVAPDDYFVAQVTTGSLLLGAAVGIALALRAAAVRECDRAHLLRHWRPRWTALLLIGVASGFAVGVLAASSALGIVAGLVVAGVVTGIAAPRLPAAHLQRDGGQTLAKTATETEEVTR